MWAGEANLIAAADRSRMEGQFRGLTCNQGSSLQDQSLQRWPSTRCPPSAPGSSAATHSKDLPIISILTSIQWWQCLQLKQVMQINDIDLKINKQNHSGCDWLQDMRPLLFCRIRLCNRRRESLSFASDLLQLVVRTLDQLRPDLYWANNPVKHM